MKSTKKHPFRQHLCTVVCLILVCTWALLLPIGAEIYLGRYNGQVAWSFETDTGELRIYGDCGSHTPPWQPLYDRIRSVFVAPGTTRIPDAAFRDCTQLTTLTLPETVSVIGAYAFENCGNLVELTLPASLTYIGEHALRGCGSLQRLYYTGSSEQWETLCLRVAAVSGNDTLNGRTPHYTQQTYTLTVLYIDEETGEALAPAVVRTLTSGAGTTVVSPTVASYETDEKTVSVTGVRSDLTVTVRYRRTQCHVLVHFVDETSTTLLPSQQLTLAYGGSLSFPAPEIEGYEPPSDGILSLSGVTREHTEHTFVYSPRRLTVTLHCLDEGGTPLCEPQQHTGLLYGSDYELPLPDIEGYLAPVDYARGSDLRTDLTLSYSYAPRYLTVTLCYVDTEGTVLCEADQLSLRYGTALSRTPRAIDGYRAIQGEIALDAVKQSQQINVVYERAPYTLTVRHVSVGGTLLRQTQETLLYGQTYTLTPLSFTGYLPLEQQPSALSGVMPAAPLTVTLQYRTWETGDLPTAGDSSGETPAPDTPGEVDEQQISPTSWLTVACAVLLALIGIALLVVLLRGIMRKKKVAVGK